MEHTGFPSEETLAAFMDGRLDAETRRRVVEHLAECSECYETFLGVGEWGRHEGNEVVKFEKRPAWRPSFAALIGIAAAVAIFVAFPGRELYERFTRPGMKELAAAANKLSHRPIDTRLTGDFEYKDHPVPRGEENGTDDDEDDSAIIHIALHLQGVKSVAGMRTAAGAHLLLKDPDEAVRLLEKALLESCRCSSVAVALNSVPDAALLSDLGAAYYQRAVSKEPARTDLPSARAASERAWNLNRTPEAAWNRAKVLERENRRQAVAAWHDYLRVDPDPKSQWAQEAKDRIEALQ